jgi:hypothetical protein
MKRRAQAALRPIARRVAAGLFAASALAAAVSVSAADFGIVLGTEEEYASTTAGENFGYTGNFAPWFSAVLGEKANLYFSGKLTLKYGYGAESWEWPPLVELERTELNFRPVQPVYLTLGRQWFRDQGGMIASGLFDGLHGTFGLGRARLSGGVFYTGFLYKETAEILMTTGDVEYYHKPLDYGDMASYFASRRVFASIAGEFPDFTSRTSLVFSALAQFDLNDYEDAAPLHSQYLVARYSIDAADALRFFITGLGGLVENDKMDMIFNFAAAARAEWELPGSLLDMVSTELRWGSGAVNDTVGPFTPLSGITQGVVFTPTLPGLMNARVSYTARPHRVISVSAGAAFFGRTDLETFKDNELDSGSEDRFLGGELSGQLVWAPQSLLRLSAAPAVFFPGGAFMEGAGMRWKLNMGVSLSL